MNRNKLVMIAGITVVLLSGVTISILTSSVTLKIPDAREKLADIHGNFVYSSPFPYREISEEIDKSVESKAWIGYDESLLQRPFLRIDLEQKKANLPSHYVGQQFINRHPVLAHIIAERTSAWVSVDTARSILQDYYAQPFGAASSGGCGQYRYIWSNAMVIPTSENGLVFVSVVWPLDSSICYNNPGVPPPPIYNDEGRCYEWNKNCHGTPEIQPPSIEQRPTFDPDRTIEKSYEFVYSNALLLALTPIALLGALIWRGTISRVWSAHGFDYNHFELMVKMKGSKTRLEILRILDMPKTRQMIAYEVNIDWKAVDRHVKVLLKNDLIKEVYSVARTSYYVRSDKGDKLLDLLNNEYSSNNNVKGYGMSSIVYCSEKGNKFLP